MMESLVKSQNEGPDPLWILIDSRQPEHREASNVRIVYVGTAVNMDTDTLRAVSIWRSEQVLTYKTIALRALRARANG